MNTQSRELRLSFAGGQCHSDTNTNRDNDADANGYANTDTFC